MKLNLIISQCKAYFQKSKAFLSSDLFLAYFAALPLFFSWIPNLTWRYENDRLRSISIYGFINLVLFFSFLVLANVFFWIPYIGEYAANFFHLIGILTYFGISGFLVYLVATGKNIDLPIVSLLFNRLVGYLEEDSKDQAPIAQLDRASDYGSEG